MRLQIASATSTGTTSISAPNAPVASSCRTAFMTSIAVSAVLPTAFQPPVQVRRDGISPTWPMTGMLSSARRLIVGMPALQ